MPLLSLVNRDKWQGSLSQDSRPTVYKYLLVWPWGPLRREKLSFFFRMADAQSERSYCEELGVRCVFYCIYDGIVGV